MIGLLYGEKSCDNMLSRFHLIPERNGRTNRVVLRRHCTWNSPLRSAGNTGFYVSRSVSAKQSGWLGNPVDYNIIGDWCRNVCTLYKTHVRDTILMQCIDDTWTSISQKIKSCWSMEKAVVCMREGNRTSLWTSAIKTSSSAVAKRPRDVLCLSVQLASTVQHVE